MPAKSYLSPPRKGAFKAIRELLASFLQRKAYVSISPEELRSALGSTRPPVVVDCRDAESFASGHIPGALNVPYENFMRDHANVPAGTPIVAVCYVGAYSLAAAQKLGRSGRPDVASLKGGMDAWIRSGGVVTEG
jgi:rhodanese-related sulfurtransferase